MSKLAELRARARQQASRMDAIEKTTGIAPVVKVEKKEVVVKEVQVIKEVEKKLDPSEMIISKDLLQKMIKTAVDEAFKKGYETAKSEVPAKKPGTRERFKRWVINKAEDIKSTIPEEDVVEITCATCGRTFNPTADSSLAKTGVCSSCAKKEAEGKDKVEEAVSDVKPPKKRSFKGLAPGVGRELNDDEVEEV